jgi:hypothetical protein
MVCRADRLSPGVRRPRYKSVSDVEQLHVPSRNEMRAPRHPEYMAKLQDRLFLLSTLQPNIPSLFRDSVAFLSDRLRNWTRRSMSLEG